MRIFATVLLLCFSCSLIHAQQASAPSRPTATQKASAPSSDEAATRADIQKMKALVQQMQTNLAFVTSTQGPLKHQFELEIEMWQLEISRMERQLNQTDEDRTRK